MTKVITVAQKKGSSGKTTTAVNIAAGLAINMKRVLLMDLDPQANATMYSGLMPIDVKTSIDDVFTKGKNIKEVSLKTKFNYDIIPSSPGLEHTVIGFNHLQIFFLRDAIKPVEASYDYIIFDTPPLINFLTTNALCASDYVILPMQTNAWGLDSIENTINVVETVRKNHNKKLKLLGILPTLYNTRGLISKVVLKEAQIRFGDLIMPITINFATEIAESAYAQAPGILYEKTDYSNHKALIEYLLSIFEKDISILVN